VDAGGVPRGREGRGVERPRPGRTDGLASGVQAGRGQGLARRPERQDEGLAGVRPCVRALREGVGVSVGLQVPPFPRAEHDRCDERVEEGGDHASTCFSLHDPEQFVRRSAGNAARSGQKASCRAREQRVRLLGKGRVSDEVVAGAEPIARTAPARKLRAPR